MCYAKLYLQQLRPILSLSRRLIESWVQQREDLQFLLWNKSDHSFLFLIIYGLMSKVKSEFLFSSKTEETLAPARTAS
jgi:hypothetical protein